MATAEFTLQVASLYRQESERLRRRARRRLPDVHTAEDVLQDVFKVLSERGNFEGIKSPAGYAHAVMDKLIATRFRLKYLRPEVLTDDPCEGSSESADVAAEYEGKELSTRLHQSMNDLLTPRDRHLLALYGLGYRPGEIAQMETEAGRSLTSRQVSWAVYNAMARLRRRLAPESFSGLLLPMWFRRMRARMLAGGERLVLSFGEIDAGSLIAGVAVAALISVGQPARPDAGPFGAPRPRLGAKIAGSGPLLLEDSLVQEPERASLEPTEVTPNASVQRLDSHPPVRGFRAVSQAEGPFELPAQNAIRPTLVTSEPQVPEKTTVQTPTGGQAELTKRHEEAGPPPPPLREQTVGLIEDPGEIPLPQCKGASICEDLPKHV